MHNKNSFAFLIFLIFIISAQLLWCQSPSTISGIIVDTTTNEPLISANIIIVGTGFGAASDLGGKYKITDVPAGKYFLKCSYVGYRSETVQINLSSGEHLKYNFKLKSVNVEGKTVVVTAQANGQNEAINQQLTSNNIVNIVSAARIKQLPDANAAESVGRLPGVFLVRSYGEGSEVAIRGLQPQYNQVLIDGVKLPASATDSRSTDLSMISSNMLGGIELYKTVTPDMDAAVLGGTVNFQIKEAQKTPSGLPGVRLSVQGGYNNLQKTYNDYKFSGMIEKRFFNNNFGILGQAIVENKNLTADVLGGSYGLLKADYYNPGTIVINNLSLSFNPTNKKRYDGTLVIDYRWNSGKLLLMNFLSRGNRSTESFKQDYNIGNDNNISYTTSYSPNITNVITNIFDFQQKLLSLNMDVKISHSYVESINPDSWDINFLQSGAGVSGISQNQNPEIIAQQAATKANLSQTTMYMINTSSDFTRQRNISAEIDFNKEINFSPRITAIFKFGGKYLYTFRSYDYSGGIGYLYTPIANVDRRAIIRANPWMTLPPYNINPNGNELLPYTMFLDPSSSFETFLSGKYSMIGYPTNIGLLSNVKNILVELSKTFTSSTASYMPDQYSNIADDYSGKEYENAGYIMGTFNIGDNITLIPGVRYQGLETRYKAAKILAAYKNINNTYPLPFPHTNTTVMEYHGYWLPDISLRYKIFTWFDIRFSYTNTLSYPNFNWIIPKIHVFNYSADWSNYKLKPTQSQNYDLALSFHNNYIGLFTIDPFLKNIKDFIFSSSVYITDPSKYPGLPQYTKGYLVNTQINNSIPVDLWGLELDWQTHFWYLPGSLTGLVMSVNYTHIFSAAKYPFVMTHVSGYPPIITRIDTFYTARLIDQPDNIINLSFGYDIKGFSALVSLIYQANVFSGTNFWPTLRQYKSNYLRWDFSAKQELPWFGLEVFFDINNINGEPDEYVVQGTGFPSSEQSYGMTADLGIRWRL